MPLRELAPGTGLEHNEISLVDIVAVHGLNPSGSASHAWDTWRKPAGPAGNLWLRDQLPEDLPNARIFLYEYNASPAFNSGKDRFIFQANDFLEALNNEREDDPKRPLILIGHSLGGILIKQALVNAHNNPDYTSIKDATFGLVFFGTPHAGGSEKLVTMGRVCSRIVTSLTTNPGNDIMEAVTKGSLFADVLQEAFRQQLLGYKIVSFWEGIGDIVPRDSAVIGLPGNIEAQLALNAAHSDMCRFDLSILADQDNFRTVKARVRRLYREVVQVQTALDRSVETEILESLRFEEMNQRYEEVVNAHKQTFDWIYESTGPQFVQWLRDTAGSSIYWISGKPGSGKSTLMKYAIRNPKLKENVREAAKDQPFVLCNFFFHDRGTTMQKSLCGLLRSIIRQIVLQFRPLVRDIIPLHVMQNEEIRPGITSFMRWSEANLSEALSALASQNRVSGIVYLFIDGLDEFSGNHYELVQLIKELSTPHEGTGLQFKFCISSREWNVFRDGFKKYPGFRIQEKTKEDISLFANSRLTTHAQMQMLLKSEDKRDDAMKLITSLVEKAQGVFVWVKLVADVILDGLTDGDQLSELQRRLDDLPEELEELYERIIAKIREKSPIQESRLIFDILLSCEGTVGLFQLALAFQGREAALSCRIEEMSGTVRERICNDMERIVNSRCGGLLEIVGRVSTADVANLRLLGSVDTLLTFGSSSAGKPERTSVQYIHQTVKEFFKNSDFLDEKEQDSSLECLLASSLHFIKISPRFRSDSRPAYFRDDDIIKKILELVRSLERSTCRPQTSILEELDRTLASFTPPDRSWCDHYFLGRLSITRWNSTIIGIAIHADLLLFVKEKLTSAELRTSPIRRFAIQSSTRPLLHFAVFDRSTINIEMVRYLLQKGANPNEQFERNSAWKHLILGLRHRPLARDKDQEFQLLELFLNFGAEPNVRIDFDESFKEKCGYTVLQTLVETFPNHSSPALLSLFKALMERGADLKIRSGAGHTPLDFASPEISEVLLSYRPSGSSQGRLSITRRSPGASRVASETTASGSADIPPRSGSPWSSLRATLSRPFRNQN